MSARRMVTICVMIAAFFCHLNLQQPGNLIGLSTAAAQTTGTRQSTASCPQDATGGCAIGGFLVVPGKLELTGNQDVFGSATLGPYAGYRFGSSSGAFLSNISIIGYFGFVQNIGGQSVAGAPAGSGSSQPGVSYGLGVSYSLPAPVSNTSFDIVLGFDHLADSLRYPYNDKPWISAGAGFGF